MGRRTHRSTGIAGLPIGLKRGWAGPRARPDEDEQTPRTRQANLDHRPPRRWLGAVRDADRGRPRSRHVAGQPALLDPARVRRDRLRLARRRGARRAARLVADGRGDHQLDARRPLLGHRLLGSGPGDAAAVPRGLALPLLLPAYLRDPRAARPPPGRLRDARPLGRRHHRRVLHDRPGDRRRLPGAQRLRRERARSHADDRLPGARRGAAELRDARLRPVGLAARSALDADRPRSDGDGALGLRLPRRDVTRHLRRRRHPRRRLAGRRAARRACGMAAGRIARSAARQRSAARAGAVRLRADRAHDGDAGDLRRPAAGRRPPRPGDAAAGDRTDGDRLRRGPPRHGREPPRGADRRPDRPRQPARPACRSRAGRRSRHASTIRASASSSTSTASRPTTTRSAIRPATSC